MKHPEHPKSAWWRTPLVVLLLIGTLVVSGAVPALAAVVTTPGAFSALAPSRLLDTRTGLGLATGTPAALAAGATLSFQVAGRGGVPTTGAGSVVLNVTVTAPTAAGRITVYADGTARPATTNVSFAATQTVANLVVSRIGTDGKVNVANVSGGTVHLVADVSGYYLSGPGTAAGTFTSLTPVRVLDTAAGVGAARAPVSAGASVSLLVAGAGGVPASGVGAVIVNVTATAPTSAGAVTVYPAGASRPVASNLNFTPSRTSTNMVEVRVGVGGRVVLFNGSAGTLTLSADVAGYYAAGAPAVSGAFGALAPVRLLDTRTRLAANPKVAAVVAAARSILGVPYSYGGGTPAGPSRGIAQGANTVGFDCSASVQYEYAKAGVMLARMTTGQEKQGTAVSRSGTLGLGGALSGDLLFWGTPRCHLPRGPLHRLRADDRGPEDWDVRPRHRGVGCAVADSSHLPGDCGRVGVARRDGSSAGCRAGRGTHVRSIGRRTERDGCLPDRGRLCDRLRLFGYSPNGVEPELRARTDDP
jgi:cell wall-associated NlpC family hydrolase